MSPNLLDGRPILVLLIGVAVSTTSCKSDPGSILKDGHSGKPIVMVADTAGQMAPIMWLSTEDGQEVVLKRNK